MRRLTSLLIASVVAAGSAWAQSDTLPSASSTSGITVLSPGSSLKPQETTPTGPRTPQSFPAGQRNAIPGAPSIFNGR